MKIDAALILSAGYGTRMGPVGEALPKVMWPIFDKPMIDLHIAYAKKLGIKEIYVNTHFLHEKIESHLRSTHPDVMALYEPTLLDVGGAIHNLNKKSDFKLKTLLVLNGDVINLIDNESINLSLEKIDDSATVLFSMEVKRGENYNELEVEDGRLKKITPSTQKDGRVTYSGQSLINLTKINHVEGITKFFDSVANFHKSNVSVINPKSKNYFDFGTSERYFKMLFKVVENPTSELAQFLRLNSAFDTTQLSTKTCSYRTTRPKCINLSGNTIDGQEGERTIVLKGGVQEMTQSGIYYNELLSPVV